ncbi:hypothetical protein [Allomuricauda sp. d1]|uniref:hypothetical protein n=1 Tax=Allomuricauda sp. d1 TaxID=3136725 RepID=UPI0031E2BD63
MFVAKYVKRDRFLKELSLGVLIFFSPFLVQFHLLFSETDTTFNLYSWEYSHGYDSNLAYAWMVLLHIIPTLLIVVYYFHTIKIHRYAILVCLYWLSYDFLKQGTNLENHWLIPLVILLIPLFSFKNKTSNFFNNFKIARDSGLRNTFFCLLLVLSPIIGTISSNISFEMKSVDFHLFELGNFGFPNFATFLWYLALKLLVLTPMVVFFLSEKKWWRYALLSPILVTMYQLRTGLKPEIDVIDEHEIFEAMPLLLGILLILLFLAKPAYYQNKLKTIYQKNHTRAEELLSKKYGNKSGEFENLKNRFLSFKEDRDKNAILEEELLSLKSQLENELQKSTTS